MDLVDQQIGKSGELDLKIEGGKLVLSFGWQEGAVGANVSAQADPDYFIDKLAALIPGSVDDAIFGIIKGALKSI